MASPSRRLAADPKRRGFFAAVVSGQGSFGHSGHTSVCGERPKRFTCRGWGVATVGVTTRHLRVMRKSLLSQTWSAAIPHLSGRPTRAGADAPDRRVLFCRRGARLSAHVGPTNKTRERSSQLATKNESHLAAARVGAMCNTWACDSGERTRSSGGALLSSVSLACQLAAPKPLLTHRISARIEAS